MTYDSTSRRRSRINRQYRDHLLRRLIDVVGAILFTVIIGTFFSFVLINWISGCGERFPTADGGYVQGECVYPSDLWNDYRQSQTTKEN
jgi:hypothetical protein